MSKWTKEENKFLEDNYTNMSYHEIAKFLQKTPISVCLKRKRMGFEKKNNRYPEVIIGNKYGFITVLNITETKRRGNLTYNCFCDCGVYINFTVAQLNKKKPSCGCQVQENISKTKITEIGRSSFSFLRNRAKQGAKSRKIFFELTYEDVKRLVSANCHYCGRDPEPFNCYKGAARKYTKHAIEMSQINANGIDRKNPYLGYTLENCVTCCSFCNYSKRKRSYEEYFSWIKTLVSFHNKNGIKDGN